MNRGGGGVRDLGRVQTQKLKSVESRKLAMQENAQELKLSNSAAHVSSPKMSSSVPDMPSSRAGVAAKGSAAGTYAPDETNEPVVTNGPVGTNRPAEKSEYCCPVDAEGDQEDGPAGAGARAGRGADTAAGADADEAAADDTGARRRREAAVPRVLDSFEVNNASNRSPLTLW